MKMEQTECFETLAFKLQTVVKHPERKRTTFRTRWKSDIRIICDLYERSNFFDGQIEFGLEGGKNINRVEIFNKKQQSKDKFEKMTKF
jgi:hypothetical protein